LKKNSSLTKLNLAGTKIGDEGTNCIVEVLKHNHTLRVLNLKNNKISAQGAKLIAEYLKTNPSLTTLDLQDNDINTEGAKILAEALKTNYFLTTLSLDNYQVDAITITEINSFLERNKKLAPQKTNKTYRFFCSEKNTTPQQPQRLSYSECVVM